MIGIKPTVKTRKTVSVEEDQNQAKEAGLDGKESNSKVEKTVSMEELAKVWHQCVPSFSTMVCTINHYYYLLYTLCGVRVMIRTKPRRQGLMEKVC